MSDPGTKTFDLFGSKEKELVWIEGTTRRFDGYNYSGKNPERVLGWFAKYMGKNRFTSAIDEVTPA